MFYDQINKQMNDRVRELGELQRGGKKIVGYFPGGYMPEEMVYACGAVPVALNRGGDHEAVEVSGNYLSRFMYTFVKAHIGYKMLKNEPLYEMVDIFVVPVTDTHVRMLADAWDVFTDVEVFRFGVPHVKHQRAEDYYRDGLYLLQERLEQLTGNKMDESKLVEAIELANKERALLQEISLMRKLEDPPISGVDFIRLNHASLLLDKKVMVSLLESIRDELKKMIKKDAPRKEGSRILLSASALAHGDYMALDLIEEAGGNIVIEESGEGIRHYWETVDLSSGNPVDALAKRYFTKRVPPSWFRPGAERLERILELAKEYKVDGVIWYQMMYRESDDFESYWYQSTLKEKANLPMLKLSSDYDHGEQATFKTRIETFMEMMK